MILLLIRFWKNEDGQATTEYILMLALVVTMVLLLIKKIVTPVFQKLGTFVTHSIQNQILKADLHTFRVGS